MTGYAQSAESEKMISLPRNNPLCHQPLKEYDRNSSSCHTIKNKTKHRHVRHTGIRKTLLGILIFVSLPTRAEQFVFTTAWTAQAQFAGYYIAKEKGFYSAEGLDVVIQHPSLTTSLQQRLKTEKSDAFMLTLMSAIDLIAQGIPMINIFQDSMNSSNLLISRWDNNPLLLKGKKVAVFNTDLNYSAFILNRQKRLNYQWVRFTSQINLFLSGAVDATIALSYNEYYQLLQSGFKLTKENVFRFSEHGYNIQEHGVYVTPEYYRTHQEECRRFARASRKGWEWASSHPDEALDIVMKYVRMHNSPTNPTMQRLMLEEVIRLQIDQESGEREFRLRRDMVEKASRLMLECGLIKRLVTYKELLGL